MLISHSVDYISHVGILNNFIFTTAQLQFMMYFYLVLFRFVPVIFVLN